MHRPPPCENCPVGGKIVEAMRPVLHRAREAMEDVRSKTTIADIAAEAREIFGTGCWVDIGAPLERYSATMISTSCARSRPHQISSRAATLHSTGPPVGPTAEATWRIASATG